MTTPFPAFPQGGRRSFPTCLAPPKRLREGEGGNKKGGKIGLKIMKIRKELYSRTLTTSQSNTERRKRKY